MQVCNNCGHTNADDVTSCENCRMCNGFTYHPDAGDGKTALETMQCTNCGNQIGTHLMKCPDCRFPVRIKTPFKTIHIDHGKKQGTSDL
jgi:rubredoxin